jgi:hypothetical protein
VKPGFEVPQEPLAGLGLALPTAVSSEMMFGLMDEIEIGRDWPVMPFMAATVMLPPRLRKSVASDAPGARQPGRPDLPAAGPGLQ